MAKALSLIDFDLLGYHKAELVKETPAYAIYAATATAGLSSETHPFAYLKSSCTNDQAREALSGTHKPKYVIVPKSLKDRLKTWRSLTGTGAPQFLVHEDMLWDKISKTFDDYLRAIREDLPSVPYFVTPRPIRKPTVDLSSEIVAWMQRDQGSDAKHIRVVRAPAGVGKTTISRHIVREIASRADEFRTIPIYVEATHWAKLSVERLDDLWTTIDNSLRVFDSRLHISQNLFSHLLNQGDLVFIFDGFDELCGHRFSPMSARDVLEDLTAMATEADARIMLTSRTAYWDAEVGAAFPSVEVIDLATFTKPQVFEYLEQRFAGDPKTKEAAKNLFTKIRAANQPPTAGGGYNQIAYHPLVMQLVADAAQHGIAELPEREDCHSDMLRILRIFCEREIARQQLHTDATKQLNAFQDIAVDQVVGGIREFDRDDLLIAGFDERDAQRLPDHPLVESAGNGRLRLRYDFLTSILVARYVIDTVCRVASEKTGFDDRALKVMDVLRSGKHNAMDHMVQLWPDDNLAALSEAYSLLSVNMTTARSFLFQLTKLLVNEKEQPSQREDRTRKVLELLGANKAADGLHIKGLYVCGNIERFDLKSVAFEGCTFCDVQFGDCVADETTRFENCAFEGILDLGEPKQQWRRVVLSKCRMSPTTELTWADFREHGGTQNEDVVRHALLAALGKFWKHGRLKASITATDWKSGPLGRLGIGVSVKDALLKVGLIQEIRISGVSEGGFAVDRNALGDLQQFMDNRQMTGKVAQAFRLLRKQVL